MNSRLSGNIDNRTVWLVAVLSLILIWVVSRPATAAGPENNSPQPSERVGGLSSTEVTCLAVPAGATASVSATMHLEWAGELETAYLVMVAGGSEAAHRLYINGQPVGQVPVRPDGPVCQPGGPAVPGWVSEDLIPIPVDLLKQGDNVITLTNDAGVEDSWSAANIRLDIFGSFSPPEATLAAPTAATPALTGIEVTGVISDRVQLTSTFDGTQQWVYYQIPEQCSTSSPNPSSAPVPLLVGLHGYGSDGDGVRDYLAAEANTRTWLVAAPDMHNHDPIGPCCNWRRGKRAFAWLGAQQDILDTIEYMKNHPQSTCPVDLSRIYLAGGSMGGQATAVMTAKYPDVFAAAAFWKPITDLTQWYNELVILSNGGLITALEAEVDDSTDGTDNADGPPSKFPFEYERRSALMMAQNLRLTPLKFWHDVDDQLVPVQHSRNLKNVLDNFWSPPVPPDYVEIATGDLDCPDPTQHCFQPEPDEVFDFLENRTLNAQAPSPVLIRTDESKSYYWLNIQQSGSEHWTDIAATYNSGNKSVTAVISDSLQLTVGFNLGSDSIIGSVGIPQAGLGFPATTYQVTEDGANSYTYLRDYSSGYLMITLNNTGLVTVTIEPFSATGDSLRTFLPIVIKNN